MLSTAEKATGLPADFQSTLEFTTDRVSTDRVGTDALGSLPRAESRGPASEASPLAQAPPPIPQTETLQATPTLDSGAAKNLHCPHPLPSGF
jgi:hypothetical protein